MMRMWPEAGPDVRRQALAMSSARAGIGLASIFAPSMSAKIAGYPVEHDNPTARTIGRLFGVRELLLAWLVLDALRRPGPLPRSVFAVQAAVDASDAAVQGWPLIKGQRLDRGTAGGVAIAAAAAVGWARLARRARA